MTDVMMEAPADAEVNLLGKYELGKLLGIGSSGKVYHARDLRTGQSVAVKAVSKKKVLNRGLTGHVKREISIMHRLRHPHIVRLHEVLATRSTVYFVMDIARGGELFGKVSKGRFSEDLSRRYFQQLISAVGYCHSRGVFHRDLKLENLLLDDDWNLKVTDFGLSAISDQVRPDGRLHTQCGTPAYVAPEIFSKKGYDGVKVDIWSCGIILFIMNAGFLPFNDANLMMMYRKIYKGKFRCPKWTSPDLKRLLNRLLDTNSETRITVAEILKDPWFRKGHQNEIPLSFPIDVEFETGDFNENYINAFELISFSSGIDLSGLLGNAGANSVEGERFVSAELPERIIETVEEVGEAEGLKVARKKKRSWVRLVGRQNDSFTCLVGIHRLTDKLVLVEIRKSSGGGRGSGQEIWEGKVRPRIIELIYEPGKQVTGKEGINKWDDLCKQSTSI